MKHILTTCLVAMSIGCTAIALGNEGKKFSLETALSYQKSLESSIDRIEGKLQTIDALFPETDKEYTTYQESRKDIVTIITSMKRTKDVISSDLLRIGQYQKELTQSINTVKHTQKQIESSKQSIERMTRLLYQLHNEIYEQGTIDEIKIFTKMDNITDAANQEVYMEILLKNLNTLVERLEDSKNKHKAVIRNAQEKKHDIERKTQAYHKHIQNIEKKVTYLESYMAILQENKEALNAKIQDIASTRTDIESQIINTTLAIENKSYNPQRNREYTYNQLLNLTNHGADDVYIISWPVLPIKHIQYYFNDDTYQKEYDIAHNGIRITIPQGKAVHAAKDGIVIKAINSEFGINRITLAHVDGYTTSYLYVNDIYVTEGSIVRKGQVIARTGGEAGTQGAGFFSQGANMTFLVTKGPRFINPLAILDLSAIDNEKMIPDDLTFKYKRDVQRRPIDLTQLSYMEGESERERQIEFLRTYAKGVFQSISLREQAGESHAIDPSFVICIGFAESTLGHYLTTANNMGNVGNPDNPNIRTNIDAGPLAGIATIYDTLDNRYLGHYNRIDELSRYRREDKKSAIYASSTYNRQNNVLRCLSMIKGYNVPEDYAFRTDIKRVTTNSFQTTSTSQRGR